MDNRIEIFDAEMLKKNKSRVGLIEHWSKVVNRPLGWHYWLDFIWIMKKLDEIGLPKGAWILDAGAGNGVLQFLLAALGYNVISLDYAERDIPPDALKVFEISRQSSVVANPGHRYRQFIKYKLSSSLFNFRKISKIMARPVDYLGAALSLLDRKAALYRQLLIKQLGQKRYGKIIYVMGDFTDLKDFPNESVDCVVSVSALEHADHADIKKAAGELERVLKPGGYMFLTVGTAKEKDWFFEPGLAWCFSERTLKDLFGLEDCPSNYDQYDQLFDRLKGSREIKNRVPKEYFGSGENGLPWGRYEPKYQPVGIVKSKGKSSAV